MSTTVHRTWRLSRYSQFRPEPPLNRTPLRPSRRRTRRRPTPRWRSRSVRPERPAARDPTVRRQTRLRCPSQPRQRRYHRQAAASPQPTVRHPEQRSDTGDRCIARRHRPGCTTRSPAARDYPPKRQPGARQTVSRRNVRTYEIRRLRADASESTCRRHDPARRSPSRMMSWPTRYPDAHDQGFRASCDRFERRQPRRAIAKDLAR